MRAQGLFREPNTPDPEFTDTLELDLGSVVPSLAGPKRPQDRVPLSEMKETFEKALTAPVKERGFELKPEALRTEATFGTNGGSHADETWRGGHRCHHFLHEHIQSIRDGRRRVCWPRRPLKKA